MLKIKGHYNTAIVYTDTVDQVAIEQIKDLCNQAFAKESKIRIMSDVHSGMGCTIGTTMTIKDKVVPNLVGVDIGCGLEVAQLKERELDLALLDATIYKNIPFGFNIRRNEHRYNQYIDLEKLHCAKSVDLKRAALSIGTLGGGNHFIEVNRDSQGKLYLVIHSGSRHLGHEVATLYQKRASGTTNNPLAYLSGKDFNHYLHDMKMIQQFAELNRRAMLDELLQQLNLTVVHQFTTIHNYIDTERMILRKGAVSALKGETLIIPLNMRDGSLLCLGKGNPAWNYSAPHGAGRVLSRRQARQKLSLADYRKTMQGVFTTSVNQGTLDEAPEAYRSSEEILHNITPTVEVLEKLLPIYNFKAK